MSKDNAKRNRLIAIISLGLSTVITLVLTTLRITGVIHWYWPNVFAPMGIGIAFAWDSIRRTKRKE